MNSQDIEAYMVWRARLLTKPISLLTIRDQLTFEHDGIPPGHNHGQHRRHVYGRAMRASVSLADASVHEDPVALI